MIRSRLPARRVAGLPGVSGTIEFPPVRGPLGVPRTGWKSRPFVLAAGTSQGIMKLTIERAALLKALAHVQSVVERRNTIPILSNVLMEATAGDGGGQLLLTATDMDD